MVELTDERQRHIAFRHPDFYSRFEHSIGEALSDPDLVTSYSRDPQVVLILRWYPDIYGGKYVLVAVTRHPARNWITTAYLLDETKEPVLWRRSLG
ncbi:MAG: hypothetical protein ABI743_13950 [bacterium]